MLKVKLNTMEKTNKDYKMDTSLTNEKLEGFDKNIIQNLNSLNQIMKEYLPNTSYDVGQLGIDFGGKWELNIQITNTSKIKYKLFDSWNDMFLFIVKTIKKQSIKRYTIMMNKIPYVIHRLLGLFDDSNIIEENDEIVGFKKGIRGMDYSVEVKTLIV